MSEYVFFRTLFISLPARLLSRKLIVMRFSPWLTVDMSRTRSRWAISRKLASVCGSPVEQDPSQFDANKRVEKTSGTFLFSGLQRQADFEFRRLILALARAPQHSSSRWCRILQ